jgi:uncharacterized protein YciI
MLVILLTYKKSLEEIEKYLEEHRRFLDQGYRNNFFAVSGPKNPRTGGVIISPLQNQDQLEEFLKQDPFHIHAVADYEIIEFNPTKYHPQCASWIEKQD